MELDLIKLDVDHTELVAEDPAAAILLGKADVETAELESNDTDLRVCATWGLGDFGTVGSSRQSVLVYFANLPGRVK